MCSIRVSEWFKNNLKLRSQLLLYSLKPAQCVPQPRGQGGVVGGGGGGERYLGQYLLGVCRWPLRTPNPLKSITYPIFVTW